MKYLISIIALFFFTVSQVFSQQFTQSQCSKQSGMYWDTTSNICKRTAANQASANGFQKCQQMTSKSAQDSCLKKLTQNQINSAGISHTSSNDTLIKTITTAYAALLLTAQLLEKSTPGCMSKTIYQITSLGFLASHLLVKKTNSDLSAQMQRQMQNADAYTKQISAFNIQISQQQSMQSFAKKKQNMYTILELGYVASGIMAALESLPTPFIEPKCTYGVSLGVIPLANSSSIIVGSAISVAFVEILRNAAQKQEQESAQNVKKLQAIVGTFKQSVSNFCPHGRNNQAYPNCYCYNTDGSQNTNNRSNSSICTSTWASEANSTNFVAAHNINNPNAALGCITIQQKFDPTCQCKKSINQSNKQNTCFKGNQVFTPLQNQIPNNMTAVALPTSFTQGIQSIANGNIANVQAGTSAIAAAISSTDYLNKIISKINKNQIKKGKSPIDIAKIKKQILSSPAVLAKSLKLASMFSNDTQGSTQNTLDNKDKNKKTNKKNKVSKVKYSISKNKVNFTKKKASNSFDFSMPSTSENSKNILNYKEISKKKQDNYKYDNINNNINTNIFEIISNRYLTSGIKRLFK